MPREKGKDADFEKIQAVLQEALEAIEKEFASGSDPSWKLSQRILDALEALSGASSQASSAFTNIVTCLAIKAVYPELDVRYHQVQIGAPFSFRNISEKVVYPWLRANEFEGAKSGWQTRTFERPRPYTLDFPENIGSIKQPFLFCLDEIQEKGESASLALQYLILRQLQLREKKKIGLAIPRIDEISVIVELLRAHFFFKYKGKGASRLPVLAVYSIYREILSQVKRYEEKSLRPLQSHAAADSQTGAIGDIEVEDSKKKLFEGVEIKHNLRITSDSIEDVSRKIAPHGPERYYILTTHEECLPSQDLASLLQQKKQKTGVQIIVNGVIPTIRYYLRLLDKPGAIFPHYLDLLSQDAAISHEHRAAWNDIVAGA